MALLTIGGVAQKTPSEFKVSINDVDSPNTTRNANGELMRDRIAVKRKIEMKFPPMSQSEMSSLLTAVQPVFFDVTYQDPMDGMATRTFYVGDRSIPMYRFGNGTTTQILWENVSFNLIER